MMKGTAISKFEVPIAIRALKTANIYIINAEKSIIVDSGMSADSIKYVDGSISKHKPEFLMLTHLHIDHLGGALTLWKNYGIPAYIDENDLKIIRSVVENEQEYIKRYIELFSVNGVPQKIKDDLIEMHPVINFYKYYSSLDFLESFEKMHNYNGIDIIHLPGHSPGSSAIYLKDDQMMLSGDHVLGKITPNISVYGDEDDLGLYIDSLKKVEKMDIKTIYPGHGPAINDPRSRIREILKHHQNRMGNILSTLDSWKTAYEVAKEIRWSKGRSMDTMNFMEVNFAVMETISHLKHMLKEDIIDEKEENGIIKYNNVN